MEEIWPTSGFLVVKTFERRYREYIEEFKQYYQKKYPDFEPKPVELLPGKYRGIDREPIQSWLEKLRGSGVVEPTDQELAASLFMTELEDSDRAADDFIFELEDSIKLIEMILPPVEREIIWARRMDKNDMPPKKTEVLGYEPNDFYGSRISLVAGNAFFSYDASEEGKYIIMQLEKFHSRLNKWGLFDTPTEAKQYMDFNLEIKPNLDDGISYIAEIRTVNI